MSPLESFVNSLELSAVKAKLKRSVAGLPIFGDCNEDEDDEDTNDSTLNDEDVWLSSPTQKRKPLPSPQATTFPSLSTMSKCFDEHTFTANDHLSKTSLRSFTVSNDVIPRIDIDEFHKIVTGQYVNQFDEVVIVDCRFPYEYEGGHIENAVNISLYKTLEEKFMLDQPLDEANTCKTLLVFHCEYSLLRGPTMASHLRKLDRLHNADQYPYLTYPDVVVLEGGYKSFFDQYTHLCEPQGYVEMKDTKHKKVCEKEMNKVLRASKLIRAKSFSNGKPCIPSIHTRSVSLTTILTTAEASSLNTQGSLSGPPTLHRSRSSRVHKRRDSRPLFTQSLISLPRESSPTGRDSSVSNNLMLTDRNARSCRNIDGYDFSFKNGDPIEASETNISSYSSIIQGDDFAPPQTVFRDSSLHSSLPLPLISVYSMATFSSTDSLMDVPSPFTDTLDDLDLASISKSLLSNSTTKAGFPRPRLSLVRSNTRAYPPQLSSPTVTSPFLSLNVLDDLSDECFLTGEP